MKTYICRNCNEEYTGHHFAFCQYCGNRVEELKLLPLDSPDYSAIKYLAEENIITLENEGREVKDIKQWCYEEVMRTVYGESVFEYMKNLKYRK